MEIWVEEVGLGAEGLRAGDFMAISLQVEVGAEVEAGTRISTLRIMPEVVGVVLLDIRGIRIREEAVVVEDSMEINNG